MPRRAKARPDEGAAERRIVTSQFRDDLVITPSGENGGGGTTYLIEDPVARESFSFGEEEYFLCRSMNGTATAEEILALFQKRFDAEMSLEHFHNFEEHLLSMGLARPAPPRIELPPASPPTPAAKETPKPASKGGILGDPNPRWKLFNPSRIFDAMLRAVMPVRFLFILAVLALIPAFPAALFMIFRHSAEFRVELMSLSVSLGYFGGLLFSLLAANFIRCVVQGVVCAYYGLTPQAFGFKLRRGILPRFYIDKARIRASDRHTKLWIYGTSILIRLFFVVIGAAVWAMFKGNQTLIPSVAVTMAQAGMIGILLELLPLETTDGYRWMVNFFNWPPNMIFLAFRVGYMRLTFQPLPDTLKGWKGFRYLVYSIILVVGLSLGSIKIMEQISKGFMQAFPDLFGRATQYIVIAVFGFFVLRWALGKLMHKSPKGKAAARRDDDEDDLDFDDEFGDKSAGDSEESAGFREFFQRHKTLAVVLVLIALMFVPFAYRPGGEIQVLPPVQQQIQAPVTGRIAEVHFEGGDGKLIPRGTLVAKMISSDIENELLTLEQSKSQQLATIDKLKSELAKLQSGARSDEITSAEAKLQQAVEEMNVAAQELQSAKVSSDYSTMVLPRMEKLYKSGSLAELQYEEAKKGAQIDKINVEKAAKNLASLMKARDEAQSQLNLVKLGARPEDIDSARHSVEAAQAELSRIEQQITYNKQQQTESALLMPFEGYLVDSHLDFKKGIYLWKGEIFATAQNNSQPLVEVQMPEYDMEGVEVGATAQVKLFAYPNSSLTGKVLSIQPAALVSTTSPTATPVTESVTRMFKVLIEVDKPPFTLKGGMTGFAKINAGYQPLGLLLLRPVIRFVQIEMWSWLP